MTKAQYKKIYTELLTLEEAKKDLQVYKTSFSSDLIKIIDGKVLKLRSTIKDPTAYNLTIKLIHYSVTFEAAYLIIKK